MSGATSSDDLGVYVHVPFCERVCPYCDFAVERVGRLAPDLERDFVDALLAELEVRLRDCGERLAGRTLASVYLGGGTPSLLEPDSVARLLARLRAAFPGEPREVTLEANPATTELRRVPGFGAAGVTRLSVGVQSLDDGTLKRLGRAHRAAEARRGLETCLAAGLDSLSADLIFGAPGQTEAGLLRDLDALVGLGIPHLSTYALTLEPGTPFHAAGQRGRLRLPDEDRVVRMFRLLRAHLAAAGYEHYEISSFARPGHRSRHNQRYWLRSDVLGLGPSAASLLGDLRWTNARERRVWTAGIRAGAAALAERERVTEAGARRESLYLGFRRLEGVSRAAYLRRFGAAPEQHFPAELAELRSLGLIADESGRLRLSERGILFADEVFLRLVDR